MQYYAVYGTMFAPRSKTASRKSEVKTKNFMKLSTDCDDAKLLVIYYYYYRALRAVCCQPVDGSLICFMKAQ